MGISVAYCLNPDDPDYPIIPIMQHDMLTRKIIRLAKRTNMSDYTNVNADLVAGPVASGEWEATKSAFTAVILGRHNG